MSRSALSLITTAGLVAVFVTACAAGCAAPSGDDDSESTESALTSGYDASRGNRIADRAMALWSGHRSEDLCLQGVRTSLETSGAVNPAFPRFPSAVAWDDWARANPAELARRGFAKLDVDANHIPRGSIITWRPGQCGYHPLYGHIEIVTDDASSRACSDFCGSVKKTCGAPGVYVPVGAGGGGGAEPAGTCSVHADGRLYCTNRDDAPIHASPNAESPVVNTLRTTYSWFDCWSRGELHAGGNTTWYHTVGDDNANRGWVPGVALLTPNAFDANPSAQGLRQCP